MNTRIIHTKIWKDPWFRSLEIDERLYFLYLILNQHINILHLYELDDFIAERETGISTQRMVEIKEKFVADEKIDTYRFYISVSNAYKYQEYRGIKNNHQKLRLVFELGDGAILHYKKYLTKTLRDILEETLENEVSDTKFLLLLKRVVHRFEDLEIKIPLSIRLDTLIDTGKNTEIRNQKSENRKQKDEEIDLDEVDEGIKRMKTARN